jgi:hypothetical protein
MLGFTETPFQPSPLGLSGSVIPHHPDVPGGSPITQ